MRRILFFMASLAMAFPAFADSIYVPVYSHIYHGNREAPIDLAVTISIRNISPRHSVTITAADYHDGKGKRLSSYLDAPKTLAPLSAFRFVVQQSDRAGGSGACVLVRWKGEKTTPPPLVEAVMIGTQNQLGISFLSRGIPLDP